MGLSFGAAPRKPSKVTFTKGSTIVGRPAAPAPARPTPFYKRPIVWAVVAVAGYSGWKLLGGGGRTRRPFAIARG